MAHFAEIDENNIVVRVLVVDDSLEHRGADFLANDLGLGGRWIQTSYNNKIRKQFAGIGFTYDEVNDVFILPQPYPSWSLDKNYDWQPPIAQPIENGKYFDWNEEKGEWFETVFE
ncbi:hypothetical protein UFOVP537_12 [uncultured Caudovirales phage]|uniref:Uncharacterized protein n=1 Tax=uncultured Caudovirales phage TaxID=2100421 RepID=A0A6J5MPM9_9CAUD|nr:hypothetical protein UFOVP537_12 [uncultured Caudovirales phage]